MYKKTNFFKIITIVIVVLFVAVAFHPALNPVWDNLFSTYSERLELLPGIVSAQDLPFQNQPIFNQPNKGLNVTDLINATPSENQIDTDGDGLFDTVEAVLGTDYNNTDSDFDRLSDYDEVLNYYTNPLEPDSNYDGFPDYFEVTDVPLDIDNDGIYNAWDKDNDNDMVPDGVDFSPFSYTSIKSNFNFDIQTTGKPVYMDFQIRPSNSNNLRLSQQIWNWPYDDEGSMKDLNYSEEDVVVSPTLEFTIPTDFKITAKHSEKCLEIINGSMEKGANLQQSDYIRKDYQLFSLDEVEEGYYKIISKQSGLCLEVFNESMNDEANVQQSNFTYADNQLWRIEPVSGGFYNIIAKHSGKCLEVDNGDLDIGGNVQQNDYWSHDHQLWKLEPIGTYIPPFEDMADYGIIVNLNKLSVSLSPVYDYGAPVAFKGRLFYPPNENTTISLNSKLIWKVIGKSDKEIDILRTSNGYNISVNENNSNNLIINETKPNDREKIEIIDLGNDMIALRAYNGFYISVLDNENGTLVANSTSIDEHEMFTVTDLKNNEMAFQAWNEYYVTIDNENKTIIANSPTIGPRETFKVIDAGYQTEVITLASYKENFMLTGFNIQENYGSDVALFYSTDVNQTLAASFVMSYDFLRSNQTTLLDIQQNMLTDYNVTVNSTIQTDISHMDLAILEVTSNMTPNVLEELNNQTKDKKLPIIIALEDEFALQTLDELAFGEYKENYFSINLSNLSIATSKYFKLGWYNVSSKETLETEEFLNEMKNWGLSKGLDESSEALDTYVSIVLAWNVGESRIIKIGSNHIIFNNPESPEVLDKIQSYGLFSLSGLIDIAELIRKGALSAYKFLKPALGQPSKILRALKGTYKILNGAKVAKAFKFIGKVSKVLLVIDIIISIVLGLYSWFSFADDHGWSDFGVYVGWLSYMVIINWAGLYISLAVLGGPIGVIIALILAIFDIIFGIGDIIMGWIIDLFTRIDRRSNINIELSGNPLVYTDDIDDNGIDSGDLIGYKCTVEGNVTRTSDGNWGDVCDSYVHPSLVLNVPPNSNWGSTSNLVETIQGYPNYRHETYKLGAWVEARAMINFPITVKLSYSYRVYYDECFWFFGWHCDRESTSGSSISDIATMHFDVMPGTLNDFLTWKGISALDNDGDRLLNDEEMNYTANLWRYDTDGDGLWDGFEVDRGTLAYLSDSDNDGLGDKLELQQNTDPLKIDTDADGLTDYEEWRGWQIEFTYFGNNFTMHVTSNPLVKDSDDDGLNDILEHMKHLNPRSQDTNGNGIDDYNESVYPSFGYITDVSLNGGGNSIRISPDENISATIKYRVVGVNRSDNGKPDNCSIFIIIPSSNFTQEIYNGTPNPDKLTKNVSLFYINNTLDNGTYFIQYYVKWTYGGILPHENKREIIGYIEVNASGDRTITWECFEQGTDTDGDLIIDINEMIGWPVTYTDISGNHTINITSDPHTEDTDGDGLTDLWEHNCYNDSTNPRDIDTDHDGLTDPDELIFGTNPLHFDTDLDGLDDSTEINFRSDPNLIDTDFDLLPDSGEFLFSTNPTNPDTDGDGLTDSEEIFLCNSSPLFPDSDNDTLFDEQECNLGTDPWNPDTDGDKLIDGYEVFINTNPHLKDTDDDSLEDNEELFWNTDPLINDTDNDSLSDGDELIYGTNPLHPDSDFDDILDGEDLDSFAPHADNIILAFDIDSDVLEFESYLGRYTNVTNVTADEFLSKYTQEQFIVIVGRPDAGNGTAGNITKNVLTDAGENVSAMIESDHYRFAVQYSVWTETQTVVMVSHPYFLDHLLVLNILKNRIDTILNNSVEVIYPTPRNQIKIKYLKETDAMLIADFEKQVIPWLKISRYNSLTTSKPLNHSGGLCRTQKAVGKYLEIEVRENIQNDTGDIIDKVWLRIYYTMADLDMNDDGDASDVGDLRENTLCLYTWDNKTSNWVALSGSLDWVFETGVNTVNFEDEGISYEGYIWATLSHFSLFGVAGFPKLSDYKGGFVTNFAPVADLSAGEPYFGFVGEKIIFNGSFSNDTDGKIVSWIWDFGDDTNSNGEIVDHTYLNPGNYIVRLTVTDDDGGISTDETAVVITIPNRPPSSPVFSGPIKGIENTPYQFKFVSTDDDNDTIKYIVEWGDNTENESKFLPNGKAFIVNHSWLNSGIYKLIVTVTDNKTETQSDKLIFINISYIFIEDFGYLVDLDCDGYYDEFYSNLTGQKEDLKRKSSTEYLLDINGDGSFYLFNIDTQELTSDTVSEESLSDNGVLIIVLIIIVLLFFIPILGIVKKSKKEKIKQQKKLKKPSEKNGNSNKKSSKKNK